MRPIGPSDERLQRIVRALGAGEPAALIDRMCGVCADVVGITGAGVTVRGPQLASSLCASGRQAAEREDLSLSLGEGPAVDAYIGGVPIGVEAMSASRAEVHQAAGMVSVQAGVSVAEGPPAPARTGPFGPASAHRRRARRRCPTDTVGA